MATQTQDNQEIEQAIERLSQKMRTVSDAMALARTPVKKTAANQNKAKGSKTRKVSLGKFFKYILILSLFAGLSYMLASLVSVYMEKMKNGQSQTGDQPVTTAPLAGQPAPENAPENLPADTAQTAHPPFTPIIADTNLTPVAPPAAPAAPAMADFALKGANYQMVDTELGRALDIFITVINRGNASGRPRLFEIELINKENKQLMAWPMAVAGEEVAGDSEKIYKTRLLEPPADFHNIRVSMQK
ncbi:MAG: hypothetical protein ACPGHX_07455 [Candidatus Puniceispirillaceae bacterium]